MRRSGGVRRAERPSLSGDMTALLLTTEAETEVVVMVRRAVLAAASAREAELKVSKGQELEVRGSSSSLPTSMAMSLISFSLSCPWLLLLCSSPRLCQRQWA
jgi:hypothetical protein